MEELGTKIFTEGQAVSTTLEEKEASTEDHRYNPNKD
nr:MAG TPA: hypothetical protein [Caudoviricetes sp.]